MLDIASEVVGKDNVSIRTDLVTGSEDFADMLNVIPGAYCNIGHSGTVPLHNDGFILDEDILPIGASIYAKLVENSRVNKTPIVKPMYTIFLATNFPKDLFARSVIKKAIG